MLYDFSHCYHIIMDISIYSKCVCVCLSVFICVCVCVWGVQLQQGVSGFSCPGSVQRDFWSPDLSPVSRRNTAAGGGGGGAGGGGARSLPLAEEGGAAWVGNRAALRKTVSVDDRLLQPAGGEQPHLRLLSRLERGRKKLRNIHVSVFYILTSGCFSF